MCTVPNASTVWSTQRCAESGSETSVWTKTASPFPSSARIASPARSSTSSATTTLAPSARKRSAYARPIPCPAPVMIATLSWSRPIVRVLRSELLLQAGDEIEALGDDRLRGVRVGPLGLHDDERHAGAVGLLLVDVADLLHTVEHVTGDRRAVKREFLLAVQHERALRVEVAHDRVHRIAAALRRV